MDRNMSAGVLNEMRSNWKNERMADARMTKGTLEAVSKTFVAYLPDHAPTKVGHVFLCEQELLPASRQCLKELAGEDATVVPILLLWSIL